ncbi:hypothetical protein ABPG77_006410, partial [Micractinium sp. CCAP 211/92]
NFAGTAAGVGGQARLCGAHPGGPQQGRGAPAGGRLRSLLQAHLCAQLHGGAPVGALPITDANRPPAAVGLTPGDDRRSWRGGSLPALGRPQRAKWLDVILYSREQLIKEYEGMPQQGGGGPGGRALGYHQHQSAGRRLRDTHGAHYSDAECARPGEGGRFGRAPGSGGVRTGNGVLDAHAQIQ